MPDKPAAADQRYLQAAIRTGARGLGTTWPNPSVGAILVKDGHVISAGRTAAGGRPHAEQELLAVSGGAANGATLYISLEPCAHFGKTPPCADALIAAGIGRAVVAMIDPDPRVSGSGMERLEAAGIAVALADANQAVLDAHQGHVRRLAAGRPWVTLKLAVSGDGMIGRRNCGQVAITGTRASAHVQALRSRYDGILVGSGTVLSDDPQLTCRLAGLEARSPVRIVLDSRGRLSADRRIFADKGNVPVLRMVGETADPDAGSGFGRHVETLSVAERDGRLAMTAVLERLGAYGLTRVLVEGGSHVAASLVDEGLADDVILFRSPVEVGDDGVPALAGLPLSAIEDDPQFRPAGRRRFGNDTMVRYRRVG
jgi:diaminohydroxyphosphoribosylaminopyrimidine deaminase/5-amino-6-(5-phosphoribosylamino)uracil reductase